MTKEAGGMKQTFAILDDTLIDQIAAMNGAEVDPDAGSVETYDENTARQLAAFAKKNPQRLKQTQSINRAGMKPMAQRVGGTASGPEYNLKEEGDDVKAAMKLLKKAGYKVEKTEQELEEKAVSKKQQRFMGMVHATQKGEKAPSKEVAKVAKSIGKKDAEDFAATKHKGLPEKKAKKKEEVEETTVAGNVAPAAAPKASKGGMTFGKGIYDSMNRELEQMIAESMNISMSMNNDMHGGPSKSLTVTATDEDAMMLGKLLKMAGVGSDADAGSCGSSAEQVDENQPEWPTDQVQSNDALQYSGGLNKPKTTVAGDGQTTVPVTAVQVKEQTNMDPAKGALAQRVVSANSTYVYHYSRGADTDEMEANRDKLQAEWNQKYPGEDAKAVAAQMQQIQQQQADKSRVASTMQQARRGISGMYEQEQVMAPESEELDETLRRIKEMAGIKTEAKKVEEDDVEEGNKFTGNLAKARAAGKDEADLDGDGDLEKVKESVNKLWRVYKG
jgi:hypothetical protein